MAWKKNHFELITDILMDVRRNLIDGEVAPWALDAVATGFADAMTQLYPDFDRVRFLEGADCNDLG